MHGGYEGLEGAEANGAPPSTVHQAKEVDNKANPLLLSITGDGVSMVILFADQTEALAIFSQDCSGQQDGKWKGF